MDGLGHIAAASLGDVEKSIPESPLSIRLLTPDF